MQIRKAARVLPDPVGAEISVVRPASICGQPCSCGSVGVPNLRTNHSCTIGWAQARESETGDMSILYRSFVKLSPGKEQLANSNWQMTHLIRPLSFRSREAGEESAFF